MLVLLFALAAPSLAQNLCGSINVTCGASNDFCDPIQTQTLLVNHTFKGCASPLVCAGRNWTCRTKPVATTPCEDDEDCMYYGQTDTLVCDKSGSTHMCAWPADPMPPTNGCRANGDVCTMDSQCAWGKCVSGWCEGLLVGANCAGMNMSGCAWNLWCWENMTDPTMNHCAAKIATGQPAMDHSTMGWGYSCQSGFARNISGTPTCVSYDAWWGKVAAGGECYYDDLDELSHELCMDGYYCAPNSTCSMDRSDMPNCTLNSADCWNKMRPSNGGTCHCESNNANPMCVRPNCGQAGMRAADMWKAGMKCGAQPQPMQGMCPNNGMYDENWNGSCSFRVGVCHPSKSYQMCAGDFEVAQWKKVLFPSGNVCGMSLSAGSIYWPSYCSSAALTQPLLVLVVGLMALLRL